MRNCLALSFTLLTGLLYAQPPQQIPYNLYNSFTLNGQVPVLHWYIDNSQPNQNPSFYSQNEINSYILKVAKREVNYYGNTDTWLYQALTAFPIQGKTVGIIGSVEPWYESVILAFGGKPVTIEYNKILTDDPRLTLLTAAEYEKDPIQFDVVLSISSTEHDGLGRYGDPINPTADLEFMAKIKNQMLKPGGHLILAVPVGRDCLVWNAHRIYGPRRLSLLLDGWQTIDTFGFDPLLFNLNLGDQSYQPVFLLMPS